MLDRNIIFSRLDIHYEYVCAIILFAYSKMCEMNFLDGNDDLATFMGQFEVPIGKLQ